MQTPQYYTALESPEFALDKILAHDKWKLEQQLIHDKWVVEFNAHIKSTSRPKIITTQNLSEDDVLINELTGYGELDETHIGKLSKTPVWQASENRSRGR
jgi:hypothetical protein